MPYFKPLKYDNQIYSNFYINKRGIIWNIKTNNILKHSINHNGYAVVYLSLGTRGKVKCIRVHKAVAETFIINPDHKSIVHHEDENKMNCDISNLKWVTDKENIGYHLKNQSQITPYFNNRKLTREEVNFIINNKYNYSYQNLANMFNVSKTTICHIINKQCYNNDY